MKSTQHKTEQTHKLGDKDVCVDLFMIMSVFIFAFVTFLSSFLSVVQYLSI